VAGTQELLAVCVEIDIAASMRTDRGQPVNDAVLASAHEVLVLLISHDDGHLVALQSGNRAGIDHVCSRAMRHIRRAGLHIVAIGHIRRAAAVWRAASGKPKQEKTAGSGADAELPPIQIHARRLSKFNAIFMRFAARIYAVVLSKS